MRGCGQYWGYMGPDAFAFVRVELPTGQYTFNATQMSYTAQYDATARPTSVTVKGTGESGQTVAVTYTPLAAGLNFGKNPVEDLVSLTGTVCWGPSDCTAVSARGWGQLIGGIPPWA
jgi:hypothetical protein